MQALRSLLPYVTVVLIIAAIYAGWTIFSRSQENRRAEQAAKQAEADADRRVVNALGGEQLKILAFYASPGVVKRGQKALVCYGVSNAKTVRIEPRIDDITPSLSRCLDVVPQRTTEYKLIAADAAGHESSQSLVLQVK